MATAPAERHVTAPLRLQRYSIDQGLSQASVEALAGDDNGFLWIGTQEGLNRFDGQHFTILRNVPGRTDSLLSSSIDALAFDARGRLWAGTNDAGLEVLSLRSGERRRITSLPHPQVNRILVAADDGAWLGTAAGIAWVPPALDKTTTLARTESIVGLARTGQDAAFALDRHCGLWRLDRVRAVPAALEGLPAEARCVGMARDAAGWWIATAGHGLFLRADDGRTVRRSQASGDRPLIASAFARLRDGTLLLGHSDGSILHGDGAGPLLPLTFDAPPSGEITEFFEHADGVLWIGTHTEGLLRVAARSPAVRADLAGAMRQADWDTRSVRAIWRDARRTLVGTDGGMLHSIDGRPPWQAVPALAGLSVRAFVPIADGGWWVGTMSGLWRLREDLQQIEPVSGAEELAVYAVLDDGDGVLVAHREGLARVGADGTQVRHLRAFAGQMLTTLARDPVDGSAWVGSNHLGAYRIARDGKIERFDRARGILPLDSVWAIHPDREAIWFGVFSGGLVRFDRRSGEVLAWSEAEGLSNNVVYAIVPDAHGRLWLPTNNGVSVLDPDAGTLRRLGPRDGLLSREYNSGAAFAGRGGLIHFGGISGLDVLDPSRLEPSTPPAKPVLTRIDVVGRGRADPVQREFRGLAAAYKDRLRLRHDDTLVTIGLVAMDMTAPDTALLRYRIRGSHDEWIRPKGPATELTLSHPASGDYLLEVQAAGRDGVFGPSHELAIDVRPPPWLHPAAIAGWCALLLAAAWLALAGVRARERREHARAEQLNLAVEERTRALAELNAELRVANQRLDAATHTDALTGVPNRREFARWLAREAPRIQAEPGHAGLLFFMLDLDNFKRINDTWGHQSGDAALSAVAARLRDICREHDILVRWGGEEFLLAVRDPRPERASELAERLRQAVASAPVEIAAGHSLWLTVSVGFAPWPIDRHRPEAGGWELSISLADRALYAAKRSGKNAWIGMLPGDSFDRDCVQLLASGVAPSELRSGCLRVVHSTPEPPVLP